MAGVQLVTDVEETIWSFGGVTSDGQYQNTFMNLTSRDWVVLHTYDPPPPRSNHSMCVHSNYLYVFGGINHTGVLSDMYRYNIHNRSWSKIDMTGPCPTLAFASRLIPHDNNVILYGGFNGHDWNDTVLEFNVTERSWTLHHRRDEDEQPAYATCEMLSGGLVVIGGTWQNSAPAPNQHILVIKNQIEAKTEVINGKWNKKTRNSTLVGARVLENQFMNNLFLHTDLNIVAIKEWFHSRNPDLFNLRIIYQEDCNHQENIIYCNTSIIKQSSVLRNMKKTENKTQNGIQYVIYANHDYILNKYSPELLEKAIGFLYFNQITNVLMKHELDDKLITSALSQEQIQELYCIAVDLKIPLLQNILCGDADFKSINSHNYGSYMLDMIDELLEIQQYSTAVSTVEWNLNRSSDMIRMVSVDSDAYILAHKGLLMYRSDYFKGMFRVSLLETKNNELFLEDTNIYSMKTLVSYMYTGQLPVISPKYSLDMYMVSHQFQIKEAQVWLRGIIKKNVEIDTVCYVLHIADMMNDENMLKFCIQHFASKYHLIEKDDHFQYLPSTLKSRLYVASTKT
ncbi:hypothetical protein AKO1_001776 [Acrasis kona]|uniref:BTB domain-containing protein n=1 Tax=Acrasis kona TaxID=1008807 RepID=A0AAW2Z9M8_9EUKA